MKQVSEFASAGVEILGAEPQLNEISYLPLMEGRWLNEMDVSQKRQVIVLGDESKRLLFPGRPAIGSTILLNGIRFEVIGTLKRLGHGNNNDQNLKNYLPFSIMREDFPPLNVGETTDAISLLQYQPTSRDLHEEARMEVHKVIGRNHGIDYTNPDSFDEWDTIRTVDQIGKIFDAMNTFLGSVGLVTLALGAIGIINIMLVAVADRTREIGLRKALGATNRSIMFQFFVEGAFLTLLSGGLGMAGAAGLMAALATLPQPQGFDTPRLVPSTAALAIFSLAFAGVVAGLYPARKAAGLAPVEALRRE
jgi:putative ABC transport system permease protein